MIPVHCIISPCSLASPEHAQLLHHSIHDCAVSTLGKLSERKPRRNLETVRLILESSVVPNSNGAFACERPPPRMIVPPVAGGRWKKYSNPSFAEKAVVQCGSAEGEGVCAITCPRVGMMRDSPVVRDGRR